MNSTTDMPTTAQIPVAVDSPDPRAVLTTAMTIATSVVDGADPSMHRRPTPCGHFDVEQLLGHLVFVLRRIALLGRGEPIQLADETLTSDDWSADWRAGLDEVTAAWADDSRLSATVTLPWATMTGAEALGTYISEITVHTWDLATATGQPVAWDDLACATALAAMQRELPVADRDPIWQQFTASAPEVRDFSPPFANAVAVPNGAPLIDRLVAWTGRRP